MYTYDYENKYDFIQTFQFKQLFKVLVKFFNYHTRLIKAIKIPQTI